MMAATNALLTKRVPMGKPYSTSPSTAQRLHDLELQVALLSAEIQALSLLLYEVQQKQALDRR